MVSVCSRYEFSPGARTTTRRARAGRTGASAFAARLGAVFGQPDAAAVQIGVVQLVDGVAHV